MDEHFQAGAPGTERSDFGIRILFGETLKRVCGSECLRRMTAPTVEANIFEQICKLGIGERRILPEQRFTISIARCYEKRR